jgi:hypothetical protein
VVPVTAARNIRGMVAFDSAGTARVLTSGVTPALVALWHCPPMAFGQTSGPSASTQQLAELVELLRQAGYDGFREARHPFGLSQRQSNGKFTRDEAVALIHRLANGETTPPDDPTPTAITEATAPLPRRKPAGRSPATLPPDVLPPDTVAMAFPDELLAEELTRRGWTCTPPATAKTPQRPAAPRKTGPSDTDKA